MKREIQILGSEEMFCVGDIVEVNAMNPMCAYSETDWKYLGFGKDVDTGEEFEIIQDRDTKEVVYTEL